MPDSSARRPYRVVFTPATGDASTADPHPARRGTIVDLDTACAEARTVARDGGTAEVVYVDVAGARHVLAVYTPDDLTGTN